MPKELSEEDVYADDRDPLEAIRELRKEEGASDEDLSSLESSLDTDDSPAPKPEDEIPDELDDPSPAGDDGAPPADKADDADPDTHDKAPTDPPKGDEEGAADDQEAASAPKTRTFKANGQEFEFTDEEILNQFETVFGQSMDYTQKLQKIAPYRKMISALEQQGISSEQLNLAIDALKGNKGALQEIMKTHDIESFDLTPDGEEQTPYQSKNYGKNEFELEIDEITSTLSADPEYKITVDVIDNQWDQKSRDAIASNPTMIAGLHQDIKTGLFDKVAPRAMKMKVLDGNAKSDIEYYMLAGQELTAAPATPDPKPTAAELNKQAQDAEGNFDQASSEAQRKRAATSTRARADSKGVIDYLDDDDEAFDAWYADLQRKN